MYLYVYLIYFIYNLKDLVKKRTNKLINKFEKFLVVVALQTIYISYGLLKLWE